MTADRNAAARMIERRAAARREAENELRELGFSEDDAGVWRGSLPVDGADVEAGVSLPEAFPNALPVVTVDRDKLPRRIPHVEQNGKVCVAPSTGVLLDVDRPIALVRQAIAKAAETLTTGLTGTNEADFEREFEAYWTAGSSEPVGSLCAVDGPSREIQRFSVDQAGPTLKGLVVADSAQEIWAWAGRLGATCTQDAEAFFVRMTETFRPPDFEDTTSASSLWNTLREHASKPDVGRLKRWLSKTKMPALVILSIPTVDTGERFLVGVFFESGGKQKKHGGAVDGFREGRAPALLRMLRQPHQAGQRVRVRRLDARALVPRGGGERDLLEATVVVAGCGAVGSHLAVALATLGVGNLRLVDPDRLGVENVHRHVLGMRLVGANKAEGLAAYLQAQFPHVDVSAKPAALEAVVADDPGFVTEADLIAVAIGDETDELLLNESLVDGPPRVHTWVEPLGVGGHTFLATGVDGGCYRCLFGSVGGQHFANRAQFAAPGQIFLRTEAGCGGGHAPFSVLDASRTAEEAARLVTGLLLNEEDASVLVSWRGDPETFLAQGYELSRRAQQVPPGSVVRTSIEKRPDCAVCRVRSAA